MKLTGLFPAVILASLIWVQVSISFPFLSFILFSFRFGESLLLGCLTKVMIALHIGAEGLVPNPGMKFPTDVIIEESTVGGDVWDTPTGDIENASVGTDSVAAGDVVRWGCVVVLAEERGDGCGLIVWLWVDV
jgi:hypothetical protein